MSLVSVIIPTRDRPHLLRRALRSVLSQSHRELEVIVVDDNRGPTRVLEDAALQEWRGDPRWRVVRADGQGTAAAARNVGWREARGEWITFLDDDDEYHPEKVARQLALAARTGSALVLCGYEIQLAGRRRRRQVHATGFSGDGLLLEAIYGTPMLFLRREPVPLFDATLSSAEDFAGVQAFITRAGIREVPNVPEPLVRVHLQADGRVNTRHDEHWRGLRRGLVVARGRYSGPARRRFLLRARLQRLKGAGSATELIAAGCALIRKGGASEIRTVANAWLYRMGWFRRWLLS